MKYQLWDMVSYGEGEHLIPFTLIKESEEFTDINKEFIERSKISPCVIILNKDENIQKFTTNEIEKSKIYESPDGGKTIYERDFLDYKNRKRIK